MMRQKLWCGSAPGHGVGLGLSREIASIYKSETRRTGVSIQQHHRHRLLRGSQGWGCSGQHQAENIRCTVCGAPCHGEHRGELQGNLPSTEDGQSEHYLIHLCQVAFSVL